MRALPYHADADGVNVDPADYLRTPRAYHRQVQLADGRIIDAVLASPLDWARLHSRLRGSTVHPALSDNHEHLWDWFYRNYVDWWPEIVAEAAADWRDVFVRNVDGEYSYWFDRIKWVRYHAFDRHGMMRYRAFDRHATGPLTQDELRTLLILSEDDCMGQ